MPSRHHPGHHHHLNPHNRNHLHHHSQHQLSSLLGKVTRTGGANETQAAAASSLIIQLPTTSATALPEAAAAANAAQPPNRTNTNLQPRQTYQSNCHHQAATRDLMLNAGAHRHRYSYAHLAQERQAGSAEAARNSQLNSADVEVRTTGDVNEQQTEQQRRLAQTSSDNNSEESITPPPNYHEIPGIVPSYHGRTSGPPPAYDDVINPHAPPPSYQSLFGQVREARKSSNGLVDLLRQLFLVLIGTIGCTMIIGFLLLIPITMILIGFFYINECRAENIPSFLVVGGFVWITKNMLNCYNQFKKDSQTINRPPPPPPGRRPIVNSTQSTVATTTTTGVTASSTSGAGDTLAASASAASGSTSGGQLQEVTATTSSATSTTTTNGPNQDVAATTTSGDRQQATSTTTTTTTTRSSRTQQAAAIRQPQMIGLTSYKCESFLNYFLIVWFLAGCIVVYRIYEPDYENPLSLSYCNRTVYLYAFWLMTSAFIIMALVLSCLCCLMASSLMSCRGRARR